MDEWLKEANETKLHHKIVVVALAFASLFLIYKFNFLSSVLSPNINSRILVRIEILKTK